LRIIGGIAKGRTIYTPKGERTRPTADRIKESVFAIIQDYIPNSRVLDLFAGSGNMGLEALSRGA
jgi:16S rRNA (guanine966-N2)-methyltransferase